MSADRRDSKRATDALLYIPNDDVVRSVVDGDDADWSDARSYVPSDALISSVLRSSSREHPRFKFPDWYAPPRLDEGPVRAASAMFATLQLSPSTLAASTVLHVALLLALGPLAIDNGRAERPSRFTRATAPPPRLVYFVPQSPASPKEPRRTGFGVTVSRNGFQSTKPDTAWRTKVESSRFGADSGARVERGIEERELAAALNMEFRLGGDPLRVEAFDQLRFRQLFRLLTIRPLARLRVIGTGPSRRDAQFGARAGMREAEAFARELIALGIDRERIDLDASDGQGCPEREPQCAANRSGVRTSLAPPRELRQP
jgi:hypothetical protein